jgi:hypothetical protein
MAQFPPNIGLCSLNGTYRFKLSGEAANHRRGASVASAGAIHVDALRLALVRAGEPWRRQPVADRCDVRELAKYEIGRAAYPLSNRGSEGIGAVVVAGTWLAFYVIAAIRDFVVSGN